MTWCWPDYADGGMGAYLRTLDRLRDSCIFRLLVKPWRAVRRDWFT